MVAKAEKCSYASYPWIGPKPDISAKAITAPHEMMAMTARTRQMMASVRMSIGSLYSTQTYAGRGDGVTDEFDTCRFKRRLNALKCSGSRLRDACT
jgi:hypothetical protein